MKILLVDGLNIFIRNYVVMPHMDTNGEPIGGITGFLKTLKNLVHETHADRVIVAWDGEGGSRRRRGIFAEYKQGRKVRLNRQYDFESPEGSKDNMHLQLNRVRQLLELVGVIQVESNEIEADDAIAFLSRFVYDEDEKVIASSDKDLLQLLDVKTIIYSPSKKIYWSSAEFKEKLGILPENYIFMKAFMGDASDNVKGIGGIGEKNTLKLFPFLAERPVDLAEILRFSEENKESNPKYKSVLEKQEQIRENMKLMQLSHPIISPQSAIRIRTAATEQRPRFVFTEFKLELIRHGIGNVDPDFVGVFQGYKRRAEAVK